MKKTFLILASVLLLFCSACIFQAENRPYNLPYTTWVSRTPTICLECSTEEDYTDFDMPGEMIYNGGRMKIVAVMGYDARFVLCTESETGFRSRILEGECRFYKDRFVVKVDKETDTMFDGQHETLTFIRTPIK